MTYRATGLGFNTLRLRKWRAFGSGVGIQIAGHRGAESLHITAVSVRPGGARVRGGFTIEDFQHQPAGAWGAAYSGFVKKLGMRQVVATVLLPRQDVILRPLSLPGVSNKDLDAAVQFQMDGLNPYNEDDVITSWERLPGTATVLVAIARKDVVERYATLFAEAGIKIGAFTCTAATIYSGLRLFGAALPSTLLACDTTHTPLEVYGESPSKPLFSASFDLEPARAVSLAAAELRLEPDAQSDPKTFSALLGAEPALPYAAALASACPRLSLRLNLLPVERRQTSSPLLWVPAAVLGVIVLALVAAWAAMPSVVERRYLQSLEAKIAQLTPQANRASEIDKQIATVQKQTALLDEFRRRPKADMDVLAELTRLLPPPIWLNQVDIGARQVTIGGEAEQTAPLIKVLDGSPLFESSQFYGAPMRIQTGAEQFRIQTTREGAPQ